MPDLLQTLKNSHFSLEIPIFPIPYPVFSLQGSSGPGSGAGIGEKLEFHSGLRKNQNSCQKFQENPGFQQISKKTPGNKKKNPTKESPKILEIPNKSQKIRRNPKKIFPKSHPKKSPQCLIFPQIPRFSPKPLIFPPNSRISPKSHLQIPDFSPDFPYFPQIPSPNSCFSPQIPVFSQNPTPNSQILPLNLRLSPQIPKFLP